MLRRPFAQFGERTRLVAARRPQHSQEDAVAMEEEIESVRGIVGDDALETMVRIAFFDSIMRKRQVHVSSRVREQT